MSLPNTFLRKRVTTQDIEDLRQRRVTAKVLAKKYEVSYNYFTRTFNKKEIGTIDSQAVQISQKQELSRTRKAYRVSVAQRVVDRKITLEQAAKECHCTIRTIYRYIGKCSKTST